MNAAANARVRNWWIATAACGVAVILCVAFVDRTVAEYVQRNIYGDALFSFASRALALSVGAVVVALAILLGAGLAIARQRPRVSWMRVPEVCSLAAFAALAAALALKFSIGRSQVYPGYLVDHVNTVRPLSFTEGYAAFPSATTAFAAAMMAVVWIEAPRARAACVLALIGVAFALVVTNGRWVSDIIGGAFLGVVAGSQMVRMIRR